MERAKGGGPERDSEEQSVKTNHLCTDPCLYIRERAKKWVVQRDRGRRSSQEDGGEMASEEKRKKELK